MRIATWVAIGLVAALGVVVRSDGQISSGPAALVVFPHLVVDASNQLDTVVQLGNASASPVEVRCVYEVVHTVCNGTGTCVPDRTACNGACLQQRLTSEFRLRLTAGQPLAWSVARGLLNPPLEGVTGADSDSNVGTQVPAVSSPFSGAMRCVVVDDQGRPIDSNVLVGTASIETDAEVVWRSTISAAAPTTVSGCRWDAKQTSPVRGTRPRAMSRRCPP